MLVLLVANYWMPQGQTAHAACGPGLSSLGMNHPGETALSGFEPNNHRG